MVYRMDNSAASRTVDRACPEPRRTSTTAMSVAEVDAAVERAVAFAASWGTTSARERARHLRRIRREWIRRSGELVDIVGAETGKPRIDAAWEVLAVALNLDWCSWHASSALRTRRVSTFPLVAKKARIEYSPYGVVGVIAPWNFPAGIPMQVLPWAIAAGNTVVLKPSELTPRTGSLIGEVFNTPGPPLVEVVTGDGEAGAALAQSPRIGKIEFTGSGRTARHVITGAAKHLTPVVMELGGKDGMIVTPGADLDAAARTAVAGAFFNAGQTCMAVERVIAVDEVHDALVERIARLASELEVGPHQGAHVGPLTLPGAIERVLGRVQEAVDRGATVVAGGHRVDGPGDYLAPTVLVDVPEDVEVVTEENFAPVLCVIRVSDTRQAVAVANQVALGLSGSVFAGSGREARRLASQLETGGVVIGDAMVGAAIAGVPFGGEKASGYGRLQGIEGFHEFSRRRVVVENRLVGGLMARMASARPDPDRILGFAHAVLGGGGVRRRLAAIRGRGVSRSRHEPTGRNTGNHTSSTGSNSTTTGSPTYTSSGAQARLDTT
jgi:acyl-CoA reductase-like NAD-dependent aldehyde dehydrogenase